MRYYRYMSYAEFEKILKGETLTSKSQWRSVKDIDLEDNSTGFCFLREQVASSRGYFANPLECYISMSGIVCDEVLVCFEKLDEAKIKGSYGTYAPLDGSWGDSEYLDEYSTSYYSKDTFIPIGFYSNLDMGYKTFEEDFNAIKIDLPRDTANLKMLLIYSNLDLDYIEERISEFDEECFRLCAAYQKLDDDFIRKYQDKFNNDAWYELIVKQDVSEDIILSNFDKFEDSNLLDALLQSNNLNENIFDKINESYSYIFQPSYEDGKEHYTINISNFSSEFILSHLEDSFYIKYKPETNPEGKEFKIYLNTPLSELCKDVFMNADETFLRDFWAKYDKEGEYSSSCFYFFKNFTDNPNCKKIFIEKFEEGLDDGYDYNSKISLHYYSLLTPEENINNEYLLENPAYLNALVFGDDYDYSFLANNYNVLPDYAKEVIISKYPNSINNYIESCVYEGKMFNIGALYSSYFNDESLTKNQVFDKALEDIFNVKNMNYEYLKELIMYNCKNFELNGTMFEAFNYEKMHEKDLFVDYIYSQDIKNIGFIFESDFLKANEKILRDNCGEKAWRNIYENDRTKNIGSEFIASNLHKFFKLAKNDEEREEFFKLALPTMRERFKEHKETYSLSESSINQNPLYKNLLKKYGLVAEQKTSVHKEDDNIFNPKSSKFIGADTIYREIPLLKRDTEKDTLLIKLKIFDNACKYGVYPSKEQLNNLLKDFENNREFFNIQVTHRFKNILKVPDLDKTFVLEEFKKDTSLDYRDVLRTMEYLNPQFIDENFEFFKKLLCDSPLSMTRLDNITLKEDTIIKHFDFFEEKGILMKVLSKIEDKEAFVRKCPQAESRMLFYLEQDRRIFTNDEEDIFYRNICLKAVDKYLNNYIEDSFNLKLAIEDFNYEGFEVKKGMCYGSLDNGSLVVVNGDFEKNGRLVIFIKEQNEWEKKETNIVDSNFYVDGDVPAFCNIDINLDVDEVIIENGELSYVSNQEDSFDLIGFDGENWFLKENEDKILTMFYQDEDNICFRVEGSSNILICMDEDENNKTIIKKDFFSNCDLTLSDSPLSIAIVEEILRVDNKKEVKNLLEYIKNNNVCDEILDIIKDSNSSYIDDDFKETKQISLN